jgi:hypothetical protein
MRKVLGLANITVNESDVVLLQPTYLYGQVFRHAVHLHQRDCVPDKRLTVEREFCQGAVDGDVRP